MPNPNLRQDSHARQQVIQTRHSGSGLINIAKCLENFWAFFLVILDFELLTYIRNTNIDPFKKEHIHLNFFNYQTGKAVDEKWCPVNTIKCPSEFSRPDLILDVNTQEQYLFMKELYEYLYPIDPSFTILDIIKWYDNIYNIDT